jgi:hypothetical protein
MPFDIKQFKTAKFEIREGLVKVPDLAPFFPEGEEAVWKIRGLTGVELGRVNEAAERYRNIGAILEGLISSGAAEKVESIKKLVGMGNDTPADIVRRMDMLVVASVSPEVDEELAVKLCEKFPVEFFDITNEITKLTGQGHILGKPKPSGETKA